MYSETECEKIISLYANEMEIVKLRIEQIHSLARKIEYLEPTVEMQALQLRKIIEQIVLSSLIANSDKYVEYYNRLGREWNPRLICQDIKRINPGFFPKQVTIIKRHGKKDEIAPSTEQSISDKEIIDIYEHLGKLLHAVNPFGERIDYNKEEAFILGNSKKIISFLNTHIIDMFGGNDFLFVVMQATNLNGRVGINWFSKVEEQTNEV